MTEMRRKSSGVSEVVGYLLILSITLSVITTIYATGMPALEHARGAAAFQSMKTVFIIMQHDIKKVAFSQSPSLAFKLNLAEGSVSAIAHAGNITVHMNGTSYTCESGSIEYSLGTRKIIYENGAVIERSSEAGIIISEPPVILSNYSGKPHIFISVINVSGDFSAGGGITEINFRYNDTEPKFMRNRSDVSITINSSCEDAWVNYLSNLNEGVKGCRITKIDNGVNINCSVPMDVTLVMHNVTVSC